MCLKYKFLIFIFSFVCCGCASAPRSQSGKLQFSETNLPIFRIVLLDPTNATEIPSSHYEQISSQSEFGSFSNYLKALWVKECREARQPVCSYPVHSYATAFLARDQKTIWTVRHLFDEWIFEKLESLRLKGVESEREQLYRLLKTRVEFLLLNEEKEVIFDSRQTSGATFEFIGNPSVMEDVVFSDFAEITDRFKRKNIHEWNYRIKPSLLGKLTDLAALRLPIELTYTPLKFSKENHEVGDRVSIIGFPHRRKSEISRYRFDGHSRYLLEGTIVSAIEILADNESVRKTGLNQSSLSLVQLFESRFLYHDIAYAKGMSGAPVIDASGNIISIQSSGNIRGGFGLETEWIEKLLLKFRL